MFKAAILAELTSLLDYKHVLHQVYGLNDRIIKLRVAKICLYKDGGGVIVMAMVVTLSSEQNLSMSAEDPVPPHEYRFILGQCGGRKSLPHFTGSGGTQN